MALPGAYTPASITLRVIGLRIPTLHNKAAYQDYEQEPEIVHRFK
jgi:hypothetical protein